MLMLSRWPENEVEPREALTPREQAIKADNDHPLRVFYRKAPSHYDAEPSPSEMTAQLARLSLSSLRMMCGQTKKKHFVRRVFLEWVALCVGSDEKRDRKIKRVVQRRREFFTPGPLRGGCRLHLERRNEHSEWAGGEWSDGAGGSPRGSDPFAAARSGQGKESQLLKRSNSSPSNLISAARAAEAAEAPIAPGKLHSRLSHMMHMMHTPL